MVSRNNVQTERRSHQAPINIITIIFLEGMFHIYMISLCHLMAAC